MADEGITSAEGRLLSVEMRAIREDVSDMKGAVRDMARSVEKLVGFEVQQKNTSAAVDRAFSEIKTNREKREALETRLTEIEKSLPALIELRAWVIGGVVSGVGMMATGVISWVVSHPH